jgi:hypothetical protein
MPRPRQPASPFRYFSSSPEVIRLAVLLYVKCPLSLRNVEDLLAEHLPSGSRCSAEPAHQRHTSANRR